MANDIGWGNPYDTESGYGMAAITGAESGYGNIVINSYSGETNISSKDVDNQPTDDRVIILDQEPLLYVDGDNVYLYFALNPAVTPISMTYNYYIGDIFYADGTFSQDGIHWVAEFPEPTYYYLDLTIVIDSENKYVFRSNTLIVRN
jgi:hypothetical protein